VRLLGGIAIWVRASDAMRQALGREYADIDLVTSKKQAKGLRREVLERLEYMPDKMFNATQGDTRLYYHSPDGVYHVDVFVEKFVMSHELDLGRRLTTEAVTLPAAELLLTKLQIAELNHKDASDTATLLATEPRPRRSRAAGAGAPRSAGGCAGIRRPTKRIASRSPAGRQHLVKHRHKEIGGGRIDAERRLDLQHVLVITRRLHDHAEIEQPVADRLGLLGRRRERLAVTYELDAEVEAGAVDSADQPVSAGKLGQAPLESCARHARVLLQLLVAEHV
jgi:hypothetical protein